MQRRLNTSLPRFLRASLLTSLLFLCLPGLSVRSQASPAAVADETFAARAGETTVSWQEFDRLLLTRHAMSQLGRDALMHLLKSKLLAELERESGIKIDTSRIEARIEELQRQLELAGEAGGIEAMLQSQGMTLATFRDFMRLALVQEELARRGLGIPEDRPITGEQQEMWLEGEMQKRGLTEGKPPWSEGPVVSCGKATVYLPEFLVHLRTQLDPEDSREICYQVLLEKRLRARLPDLSSAALDAAVKAEISRREAEVRADPRYKGVAYEQLLSARGIMMDHWPEDPSVRVAALAQLWVERRYDEESLREVYLAERELFDGLYGEGIESWVLFLQAGAFKNDLIKRSFTEAEKELEGLVAKVGSLEEFQALVGKHSEDPKTKEEAGAVGFVTRGGRQLPKVVRDRIFLALDRKTFDPSGTPDSKSRLLGPVRMPHGVVILWLGERRPTPVWDTMMFYVHAELRKRFITSSLERDTIVTSFDR